MNKISNEGPEAKVLNLMLKIQLTKLVANIVGSVSTISSFVAPFVLFHSSGNWTNLLLLLLYPVLIPILSFCRYKGAIGGIWVLPLFLLPIRNLFPAHLFFEAIAWGIVLSYFLQFYSIPFLEKEFNRYSSVISSTQ